MNLPSIVVSLTIPGVFGNSFDSFKFFVTHNILLGILQSLEDDSRSQILETYGSQIQRIQNPDSEASASATKLIVSSGMVSLKLHHNLYMKFLLRNWKNTKFCQGGREYYSVNCTGAQIFITSDWLINFGYFNWILIG